MGEKSHLAATVEQIFAVWGPRGTWRLFSDRLTDVAVKLEHSDQHQELEGVSSLYIVVQQELLGSPLIAYQEWLHRNPSKDGLCVFSKWLQKQLVYRMDLEEVRERTKKEREDNIESKNHKR